MGSIAATSSSFEQMRADAVRRMFGRAPKHALLVFVPTFAVLSLYVAWTAGTVWLRAFALALLGGIAVLETIVAFGPRPWAPAVRWLLGLGLVAISGGAKSPALPFILIGLVSWPSVLGKRPAQIMGSISAVAVWAMTLWGPRSDGTFIYAACMTSLFAAAYFVGNWIREISDRMVSSSIEARDEILRAHDERLRDLTSLSTELAHELKNPLASIKGLAALMDLEPPRAPERLRVLRQEVGRMQGILEEVLDFSRLVTPLAPAPTNLQKIIAEVVELHSGMALDQDLTLDMSGAEPVELEGDPRRIKQMLINLVLNAIEASSPGGVIELTARHEGDFAVLRVLDRGPGVPADRLPRVLE